MALDPQLNTLIAQTRSAGVPDFADVPPQASRALYREILRATDLPAVPVQVREVQIDSHGAPLSLRLYTPLAPATAPRGLVVYAHGGGFVVGDVEGYDHLLRTLCHSSDCVVVAMDYRLAPEHPFPAAVDDVCAALWWAAAHAAELGADPTRLAVAGDSAGGNLAAVAALCARDEGLALRYQVLIYPVLAAAPNEYPSYARFGQGYVLSARSAEHFTRLYFGDMGRAPDWRGAPLLAPSVAGVAPALVLVAGHDVLRDEGVAYAERLCDAGVQATLVEYHGLAHGFINMAAVLSAARLALDQVASALRQALR